MDAAEQYTQWLGRLIEIARQRGLEWLINPESDTRRPAFAAGISPAEELDALADMAEWRGCGCWGA